MKKIAASALLGVLAGLLPVAGYFALLRAGIQVSPTLIMVVAGAAAFGSAVAVFAQTSALSRLRAGQPVIMARRIDDPDLHLIRLFAPAHTGSVPLVIRPETRAEDLDTIRNPGKYKDKEILVRLRASGAEPFNSVKLKEIFIALAKEPNFRHVLLTDKRDEYVGYIPGWFARTEFASEDADTKIAHYVVAVLQDKAQSANLRQIGGAGNLDTISDGAKVAHAMERMAGGYKTLVVLDRGYHRKPIGVISFDDLIARTLGNVVTENLPGTSMRAQMGR